MRIGYVRAGVFLLAVALSAGGARAGEAPRPAEVSAREWSFTAIQDLAARGLVHGYRDAKFLRDAKLTRFEMTSLIRRVLERLLELTPAEVGRSKESTAGTAATRGQGVLEPPTGRPVGPTRTVRTASFKEADLATVKRLTSEYSVELAVIGANLQDAVSRIEKLEGKVEELEQSLRDPEGPLQTVINNVSRIDRVKVGGYLQARYQSYQNTNSASSLSRPSTVNDSFEIRRMRIIIQARPTDRTNLYYQLEAAGAATSTRDAVLDYYLTGNPVTGPTASFGLFKAPFGFECIQSSSVREAPERARIIRFLFPDERDRGAKFTSATGGRYYWTLAVQNGLNQGVRLGNSEDTNSNKDLLGRVRTSTLGGRMDLGASFLTGSTVRTTKLGDDRAAVSAANPRENMKLMLGADLQWFPLDGTVVRGEWIGGKAMGTHVGGYILQLIQNLGKKNQAVVKYDWLGVDDNAVLQRGPVATPLGSPAEYAGTLSTWHLGMVHHLDSSTKVKLFYEIHDRGSDRVNGKPFQWLGNVVRLEVISLF